MSDDRANLIPVDHDPFADPNAPRWDLAGAMAGTSQPGYFGQIGQDISDFWAHPVAHVQQRLADIGGSFADVARGGLASQAAVQGADYSGQPLIGVGAGGELTGRLPALAEIVRGGMAGPVPGGGAAGVVLGAGPRFTRGAGELGEAANLDTPIGDTLKASEFAQDLRTQHLARGEDALPLSGATQPVQPPPHIQTPADMDALVNRYADLAQGGAVARDWYKASGQAILAHAGNPEAADKFAAALAGTSPQTDVAGNAAQAVKAWNQAMAGEPALTAGRYPNVMGERVAQYLYEGEPVTGEKIGPFMSALGSEWNPDFDHAFVNDIWNMRALGYPHPEGRLKGPATINGTEYYDATPTLGQHNFARIVADRASDVLNERTGLDWQPQQVQAAAWTGMKSQTEGTPVGAAAFNFADALRQRYAQQSWESAPGETTANMPEFHQAAPIDQQAYHDAIRGVLEDPKGRDIISQHLGLLTGPSFEGPGVFQGTVRPGSQAQTVTGPAPGAFTSGVDPATRDLLDTAEATRGLLLRQDASAWHQPVFKSTLKPGDSNLADVDIGRPLTTSEAQAAVEAMHQASGSDFFSPIATQNGFRFLNVPEVSGVKNVDFQKAVVKALGDDRLPDGTVRPAFADSGYIANDWKENPGGQGYLSAITGTGRPDLERRSAELLATLGPRISDVENQFQASHGWTPDPTSRVWENSPQIQQYGGVSVPSPPRPWATGPGPAPGSMSPLFPTGAPGRGIEAWHGTPYDFPRFDISKIGAGEGAQAYGRGLYFAGNPETARYYQSTVQAPGSELAARTGPVQSAMHDLTGRWIGVDAAHDLARAGRDTDTPVGQAAINLYAQRPELRPLSGGASVTGPHPNLEQVIQAERDAMPQSHLYQARLNVDPEALLDYDKPLSQQPQAVQQLAAQHFGGPSTAIGAAALPRTGGEFLRDLTYRVQQPGEKGADAEARVSQMLQAAGVPGVRYLDQFSRTAGTAAPSHNYVMFDPRMIDMVKKFGLGALIAGGTLALGGAGGAYAHGIPVDHDPFATPQ